MLMILAAVIVLAGFVLDKALMADRTESTMNASTYTLLAR